MAAVVRARTILEQSDVYYTLDYTSRAIVKSIELSIDDRDFTDDAHI
jgi:hypothetical protein